MRSPVLGFCDTPHHCCTLCVDLNFCTWVPAPMLRQGTYALCFTSRSKHNIDSLQIRHLRRHYRTTFGGGVGGVGIGIGTSLHTLSRALSARLLHPRDPPNNHDNNSTNDHSNRAMITARSRQAFTLFLCGTAAFLSVSPYSTTTQAENIPYRSPLPQSQPEQAQPATTTTTHAKTLSEKVPPNCPSYGCPLYPQDVHYTNETIKKAFEKLRSTKRVEADHESVRIFHQSATSDSLSVTLTLIGYKGDKFMNKLIRIEPWWFPHSISPTRTTTPIMRRRKQRLCGIPT